MIGHSDAWAASLLFVLGVLAASGPMGCTEPSSDCRQPGVGDGPCCVLVLPDQTRLQGVCVDDRCQSAEQPGYDGPCDGRPHVDGRVVDGAADGPVPEDASAPDQTLDGGRMVDALPPDQMIPDGDVRSCDQILCEPGERCDPLAGVCVSRRAGQPGGACEDDDDCIRGRCLSAEASAGRAPEGFCSVPCAVAADCDGGACLDVEEGRVCFQACDDVGGCRAGWVCVEAETGASCRVDCRVVGCRNGRCDEASGVCVDPEVPCPAACGFGESCEDARCIRRDGACDVDYNCPASSTCHRGGCVPAEFTACRSADDCGSGQTCTPVDEDGACVFACQSDADCPVDRSCRVDQGACVRTVCGPDTENGELLGPCDFGVRFDRAGTCIPFDGSGQAPGQCLEAGLAMIDEPCDAQVEGRAVADSALRCASGALCFGDPDDPLRPTLAGRGACRALCDPTGAPCLEGECVDFGRPDDPATPVADGRIIGLCLDVQCRVLAPEGCAGDTVCRPFALSDDAGNCGPRGPSGAGGPCETASDCADPAICVSRGQETICLPLCDPDAADPCGGGRCYAEAGWGFGVCL